MLVKKIEMQSSEESLEGEDDLLSSLEFGKVLGKGEFGLVKEATHLQTGEKVAVTGIIWMVFVEVVLRFFFLRRGSIGGRHMDEFAPGTLMIRAALVAVEESAGRRA